MNTSAETANSHSQTNLLITVDDSQRFITSNRELWGWWLLSFANEPITMAALTIYIPLCLEQLCRGMAGCPAEGVCMAITWPTSITSDALAVYISGLARLVAVLVFIFIGALGDYEHWRHRLLFFWIGVGGVASLGWTVALWPSAWMVAYASVLTVLIRTAQVVTMVLKNGYLPLLVRHHREYPKETVGESLEAEMLFNRVSTRNSILGFVGGFLGLLLTGLLVTFVKGSWVMPMAIGICGLWWILASSISWSWLGALPPGPSVPCRGSCWMFSVRRMLRSLTKVPSLPMPFSYMAISSVIMLAFIAFSSTIVLIGRLRLGISQPMMLLMALANPVISMFGSLFFMHLQRWLRMPTRILLCLIVMVMSMAPLQTIAGLWSDKFGMRRPWEYFLANTLMAFGQGAYFATDRVMISELIPADEANEFFSLAGIANRLASSLGPLLYGMVEAGANGEYRWAQLFILLLFWLPIPLLIWVINVGTGKAQLANYAASKK